MGMPVMSYHATLACVFVPVCSPVPYKIYAYCNTTFGCGFCLYNSPKSWTRHDKFKAMLSPACYAHAAAVPMKRYRKRMQQQIGMCIQDMTAPLLQRCSQLAAAGEDTDKRTNDILDDAHNFVSQLADIYDYVSPCFPEKYGIFHVIWKQYHEHLAFMLDCVGACAEQLANADILKVPSYVLAHTCILLYHDSCFICVRVHVHILSLYADSCSCQALHYCRLSSFVSKIACVYYGVETHHAFIDSAVLWPRYACSMPAAVTLSQPVPCTFIASLMLQANKL